MKAKIAKRSLKCAHVLFMYIMPVIFGLAMFPILKTNPGRISFGGVIVLVITTIALRNKVKAMLNSNAPYLLLIGGIVVLYCIRLIVDDVIMLLGICLVCFAVGDVCRLVGDAICDDEETEEKEEVANED